MPPSRRPDTQQGAARRPEQDPRRTSDSDRPAASTNGFGHEVRSNGDNRPGGSNGFDNRSNGNRSGNDSRGNDSRGNGARFQRRERPAPRPAPVAVRAPDIDVSDSPFTALGICVPLVQAIVQGGYTEPTPIQAQTIPHVLAGHDLLGCAQTGTGKTAAFMLPLLQRLGRSERGRPIRALVLTPTRELAAQIAEKASAYGQHLGIRHATVYGGVSQHWQERDLSRHPELVVATPGRLLDLMQQGYVKLDAVEVFVLDEADTMLDMGFLHDVRRIVSEIPKERQTLFFSATMPRAIEALAQSILKDPVRVSVTPQATTAETVEQSVYYVSKPDKISLLERVLNENAVERALVFTRTKHGADRVSKQLARAGIQADAIHGNKSQNARERVLEHFRRGGTRVLVATDIAARGIDVAGVSHVINFDLPNVAESYVHRIGRTGRAGATGRAISFCDSEERVLLRGIERLIGKRIPLAPGSNQAADLPRNPPRPPQNDRRPAYGRRN